LSGARPYTGAEMMLAVEGVFKHYGGVQALKGASFEAHAGEVHALMGENGAGKSTLAKIIAGSEQADAGVIRIGGSAVQIAGPADAQRYGIGMIYQELDLFPSLTVAENIVIGNLHFDEGRLVRRRRMEAFCRPFLDAVGLAISGDALVCDLPIGHRQLVAIARALSMDARIVLMDEPTSSLFDEAAERLFGVIADLKTKGVSIVYVSHKMDEVFRICDRITVLRDGQTVGTHETARVGREEVIRMMVGRDVKVSQRGSGSQRSEVLLEVRGLTTQKLKKVSFDLHRGEVLGVAGLVGAGRSELGAALFGLERRIEGRVVLDGKEITPRSPRDGIEAGIGLVPEDRKTEGLMMQMGVVENSTMIALKRLSRAGFVDWHAEAQCVGPVFRKLAVKAGSPSAAVSTLSGGNQQKVLLTKCLLGEPRVLFLDDPARGIDVGAKQDIYRLIRELAESGKGVILVSSELPELLDCCDRILVMREGRVAAVMDAAVATQEAILTAAVSPRGGEAA
jgi:ribose transport system ATP-binding protein